MPSLPFEIKRETLVRNTEEPSEYGKSPSARTVEELLETGIVNLNKPRGPTSNQFSETIKDILHIKKAGHSGTLDPKVTGVLPIGLGKGTKTLSFLLQAGKEYLTLMHLHDSIEKSQIEAMLDEFTTKIYQRPPIHAAVKRLLRIREIYYTDILEIQDKEVLFYIGSEAGTYIRRFCFDVGTALGSGAHMQQLIRTKSGPFNIKDSVLIQDVIDAYHFWKEGDETEIRKVVRPMEEGLSHLPKIVMSDTAVNAISHGAQLAVPGILSVESKIRPGAKVAVFTQKGEAVMVGSALLNSKQLVEDKKGLATKTERVLMDTETYPRFKN